MSRRYLKKVAIVMLMILVNQLVYPSLSWALTSGPSQPEFSSFEPVATTDMVNTFTGDFTYNLPVIDVPGPNKSGYAVSLSYHSGVQVEEEASWVGFGWTLNPGSINRSKRGIADDHKGVGVETYQKTKTDVTLSVRPFMNFEIYSFDVGLGKTIRYNNNRGFSSALDIGVGTVDGEVSLGFTLSDGMEHSFDLTVNPMGFFTNKKIRSIKKQKKKVRDKIKKTDDKCDKSALRGSLKDKRKSISAIKSSRGRVFSKIAGAYGLSSFAGETMHPLASPSSQGFQFSGNFSMAMEPGPIMAGMEFGMNGNVVVRKVDAYTNSLAYGTLYNGEAVENYLSGDYEGGQTLMDYSVEKNSSYNRRDNYLPIPIKNQDKFVVTGEGLLGSFSTYSKDVGHFIPQHSLNLIEKLQMGGEMEAGLTNGAGFSIGVGETFSESKPDWNKKIPFDFSDFSKYRYRAREKRDKVFLFDNDPAANLIFTNSDQPIGSHINGYPGLRHYKVNKAIPKYAKEFKRGASTVDWNTIGEMKETIGRKDSDEEGVFYKAHNKDTESRQTFLGAGDDLLGEFATYNENGDRYVYGLPVLSGEESRALYDIYGVEPNEKDKITLSGLRDDMSPGVNLSDFDELFGEYTEAPYANSFLLTEITTPDYIDRTLDGPTDDDFGGWTKFNYSCKHGTSSDLADAYEWRIPYNGLTFMENQKSDVRDNKGSVVRGKKQIFYLESVETKTHIAKFELTERKDGLSAAKNGTAANSYSAQGDKKLYKLDAIKLYAKNADGTIGTTPLKTVDLTYDYSLCGNVPNNENYENNANSTPSSSGKLTLKEVSFSYNGVHKVNSRPYVFDYNYPSLPTTSTLKNDYKAILNEYADLKTTPELQNPNYSSVGSDGWGNYRENGLSRNADDRPWVDQNASTNFDPAAWNLKQVHLPSGGDIYVQYEQKEYAYVQDRKACKMVNLSESNDNNYGLLTNDHLNMDASYLKSKENIDTDGDGELSEDEKGVAYVQYLNQEIAKDGGYLGFRFLYLLKGDNSDDLHPGNCKTENIEGYVPGAFHWSSSSKKPYFTVNKPKNNPKRVCKDFVYAYRNGKVIRSDCYHDTQGSLDAMANLDFSSIGVGEVEGALRELGGAFKKIHSFSMLDAYCKEFSENYSYLKIPVLDRKKGGGVRVKRLLMYDNGINNQEGKEVLYGQEFYYQDEKGMSTGVATNEPASLRMENPLIHNLNKRDTKTVLQKIVSGRDRDQFEGPYGESYLPGPSIGYSSIITNSIHSGKTANGFKQENFNTCKEFPIEMIHGTIDQAPRQIPDYVIVPAGPVYVKRDYSFATQSYSIIVNDMHGKPKSTMTYAGDYNSILNNTVAKSDWVLTASTESFYTPPGDKVKVLDNNGNIKDEYLGKVEDVFMESSALEEVSYNIDVEIDITITTIPPIVIPHFSGLPGIKDIRSGFSRHSTTKLIRKKSMLKEVVTTVEGVTSTTKHLVYDSNNGQPVVSQTYDGFNALEIGSTASNLTPHKGDYTNYSIPAAKVYKHMQSKTNNIHYKRSGLNLKLYTACIDEKTNWLGGGEGGNCPQKNGFINLQNSSNVSEDPNAPKTINTFGGGDPVEGPLEAVDRATLVADIKAGLLVEGDLVKLSNGDKDLALFYINEIDLTTHQRIYVQPLSFTANAQVEGDEMPTFSDLEVIRSGYTNQLRASAGSLTRYGLGDQISNAELDILYFGPSGQIKVRNNISNVIAASATAYSDDWYNYALTNEYDGIEYYCLRPHTYETGAKGKWRPQASYVYKSRTKQFGNVDAAGNPVPLYEAGIYDENFQGYIYRSNDDDIYPVSHESPRQSTTGEWNDIPTNIGAWLLATKINMYNPHGEPVEEENLAKIPSSAKFTHRGAVPSLVAANAPYVSTLFNSFEELGETDEQAANDENEDNKIKRHTGKQSLVLRPNGFKNLGVIEAVKNSKGIPEILIQAWVHVDKILEPQWDKQLRVSLTTYKNDGSNGASEPKVLEVDLKTKLRVGDWILVETILSPTKGLLVASPTDYVLEEATNYYNPSLHLGKGPGVSYQVQVKNIGNVDVYVDDFRMQPSEAEMTTYVYDKDNLRLLASFDSQHFARLYQYNDEGQLIRKSVETVRGVKTIEETHYNTATSSEQ